MSRRQRFAWLLHTALGSIPAFCAAVDASPSKTSSSACSNDDLPSCFDGAAGISSTDAASFAARDSAFPVTHSASAPSDCAVSICLHTAGVSPEPVHASSRSPARTAGVVGSPTAKTVQPSCARRVANAAAINPVRPAPATNTRLREHSRSTKRSN